MGADPILLGPEPTPVGPPAAIGPRLGGAGLVASIGHRIALTLAVDSGDVLDSGAVGIWWQRRGPGSLGASPQTPDILRFGPAAW